MKTITFPVGYRPKYLMGFLNSLKTQDLGGYTIIASAENCAECIKVLETCGLPIVILKKQGSKGTRDHAGARNNMYNVLNHAMNVLKSEFNVHLEDDFILSPDAMNLAEWYYKTYKDKPMEYMCYGLFNWASGGNYFQSLVEATTFHGLGWCVFKENWDVCYGPNWYNDRLASKYANAYGWDWAIEGYFKEHKCKSILPSISRTFHAGRENGTCCTTAYYDKTYTKLVWNKTQKITEFVLKNHIETYHIH